MSEPKALPRIAVVGVSSLIGEAVLDELRDRKFPHAELHALDDERHIGRPLPVDPEADQIGRASCRERVC